MFLSGQRQGLKEHLGLSRLLVIFESIVAVPEVNRQMGVWKMEAVGHLFAMFVIEWKGRNKVIWFVHFCSSRGGLLMPKVRRQLQGD